MHWSSNMACHFPQCCRVCAKKNRTLISVYGEEGLFRQLITKLKYCLQIIVLENDGLPTTICWKCLSKLEICFELMQERAKGQNEFRKQRITQALPVTLEKTEVKVEESDIERGIMEASTNDDEEPVIHDTIERGLPDHQTRCHCEACFTRQEPNSPDTNKHEPPTYSEQPSPPIYHNVPCHCEQCVNRYGSLPLLADAIDRSDAASSTSSYSKHSSSFSETSAETQPSNESGGPIRVSVMKKTIKCEFCDKLFSHTGDLNKHRRRHTGERPYPCSQCSKRFSHASNLLRHQKIHSGEMPHECPVCSKRFSRKDKMVNHMKNCHKASSRP